MNTIYTLKETAELLKTSVKTTQSLIDNGKLNAFKLGQQWRIAESSIDEYVSAMLADNKKKVIDSPHTVNNAMPTNTLEKVLKQSEQEQSCNVFGNNKNISCNDILVLHQSGLSYSQIADQLNDTGSITVTGKAWTKKSVEHQINKAKKEILNNAL